MNKSIKIVIVMSVLLLIFSLESEVSARSANKTVIHVDGKPVFTSSFMSNDHRLVPAPFFRHAGAKVEWDSSWQAVILRFHDRLVIFPSGQSYAHIGKRMVRTQLNVTTTDLPDATYIPLAFAARALGMDIHYDAGTKQTYVSTAGLQTASSAGNARQVIAANEELEWLYKITEAEAAGESYEGKVAVAASILNRVESDEWPDTIMDTIFQVTTYNGISYYQYSPVLDGRIYEVKPSEETKQAVHAALDGADPSLGAIVFYNPDKTDNQWVRSREITTVIGNHVFTK